MPTVGVFGANMHAAADPVAAAAIARRAEELGYDSLWVAEHVLLPAPRTPGSPMEPDEPILDPVVALAHLAACTTRIRLGTGVIVLPQRNPVVLAKQLASVDVLSGGRLLFGAGAGYLRAELSAIGVPMAGRGARTDEYLQAIRSLWYDEKPAFRGDHVEFAGMDAHPRPVQRPVPVVIGGHSRHAVRRAIEYGDEWYAFRIAGHDTAREAAALREVAGVLADARSQGPGAGRPPVRINVTPGRRALSPEIVRGFARLGVHRLVIRPPANAPVEQVLAFLDGNAPERIGATPDPAG